MDSGALCICSSLGLAVGRFFHLVSVGSSPPCNVFSKGHSQVSANKAISFIYISNISSSSSIGLSGEKSRYLYQSFNK